MKRLLLAAAIIATSFAAHAAQDKSTVVDNRGNAVRSILTKECVVHDWDEGTDLCAPPPPPPAPEPVAAPAPEPEPEPVASLTKEELTVYFDFAKSEINATESKKLDNFIQALVASEGVQSLSLVGYADRIGKSDANLKLSQKRTMAVQEYLNKRVDIPTEVLQAAAKGEEGSVTNCEKQKRQSLISCLAADRRVEIVLNYYVFK